MKKGVFEMTADAKVGLLLGLFFIVIIAFLVNGLPNFIQEENTSPPNAAIITPAGQDMVLDNSVPAAAHRLYPSRSTPQRTTQAPPETVVLGSPSEQAPQVEIPELVPQRQTPVVVVNNHPVVVQEAAETSKVRTHVVKSGENLAVIAKIHYKEEGNRRIVIQKLYEANTAILKSPDRVRAGHKLIIPSLDELLNLSDKVQVRKSSKGLKKTLSDLFEPVGKKSIRSISEYTVQEGDSLWSIALQSLGDGTRYKEIERLNKGKINSANNVVIGTRLIIPPQ